MIKFQLVKLVKSEVIGEKKNAWRFYKCESPSILIGAFEANAVNYLLKPIELNEFEKVMKEVIHLCEEEKRQLIYKQNMEQADKKALFYKLLTGGSFHEIEKKQLNQNLQVFHEKWMVCINIEPDKRDDSTAA